MIGNILIGISIGMIFGVFGMSMANIARESEYHRQQEQVNKWIGYLETTVTSLEIVSKKRLKQIKGTYFKNEE